MVDQSEITETCDLCNVREYLYSNLPMSPSHLCIVLINRILNKEFMDMWKKEFMDIRKGNNLFYGILEKFRRFLRPIFYNGSSLISKGGELVKDLQSDLLELKNIKRIGKNEGTVPSS